MALKGTPQERQALKTALRRANEVTYVREQVERATTGHDKVVAATQWAKAASRRMTDKASRELAHALARTVERFDVQQNWEESR